MTSLACRPEDTRRFAGLGSSPMATKTKGTPKATASDAPKVAPTLGQQLVRALVPRHFPTLTAVQMASGLAYSTLMNWKNGTKLPDWESVELMAKLAGVDPMELLGKRNNDATALRHHRDFVKAREAAQRRFPNRIPNGAYERAADTCAAQWPEHIDEVFLFNLAQFWWNNAPDSEAMQVEEDDMRAEMDAIDAKRV